MTKFLIETDKLDAAADNIDSIFKNTKEVVNSVNKYDVDNNDFDFSSAKDAIETNVKGAYGKFKLTNLLLKQVVETHTTLQESVKGTGEQANPTNDANYTYTDNGSFNGGGGSGYQAKMGGAALAAAGVEGSTTPGEVFDLDALMAAGKIVEMTEDDIKNISANKYMLIIRVDKNDPNYKSYIELLYKEAKKYGITVGIIYYTDDAADKTTKVSLMKGQKELSSFTGEPTAEKIAKLFTDVPEENKKELESMKEHDFKYYNQGDYNNSYGPLTIASGGCGPTSAAMVITYLTGETVDPVATCKFSESNGFVDSSGTYEAFFPAIAKAYNLNCKQESQTADNIINSLKQGNVIIAHMGPGTFTKGGHYIVLKGLDANGNVIVADPASRERSQKTYPASLIASEAKGSMYSFS